MVGDEASFVPRIQASYNVGLVRLALAVEVDSVRLSSRNAPSVYCCGSKKVVAQTYLDDGPALRLD